MKLPLFISISNYFKKNLKISETDLRLIEWKEIVEAILVYDSRNSTNLLTVAQQILKFDNYLNGLFSDSSIFIWKLPWMKEYELIPMSNWFESLFILCFSGTVLSSNGTPLMSGVNSVKTSQVTSSLIFRFRIIGIFTLLTMPFIFSVYFYLLFLHFLNQFEVNQTQCQLVN